MSARVPEANRRLPRRLSDSLEVSPVSRPVINASSAPLAAGGVVLVGLGAALVTFARKRGDES